MRASQDRLGHPTERACSSNRDSLFKKEVSGGEMDNMAQVSKSVGFSISVIFIGSYLNLYFVNHSVVVISIISYYKSKMCYEFILLGDHKS